MVKQLALAAVLAIASSLTDASPCPFGQLHEQGKLSAADSAHFLAARGEGEAAVEKMMSEKTKRDHEAQADFYHWQKKRGLLNLGGGLLNGALLPFTGALENLAVPVPQPFGLEIIPDAEHPYIAPGPTDVRGMCPTLNTMANHGYLNRNGITTFAQGTNACQTTLGFGYDTCAFLSGLGLLSGGDLLTGIYSIGGEDSRVPNTLGPSLGISHHGPFEIDGSISRQDTYFGNQANFELNRWDRLVQIAANHDNQFGLDMWAEERLVSYQESRDTNPEFDALEKQLAVNLAERVFIFRALPNGTHETIADFQNVAPFYLNETFPDNWFRRSTPYSLANVGDDIVALFAASPTELGENQGLNNFIPLGFDFSSLTGPEAVCFLETSLIDLLPGQFSDAVVGSESNFELYEAFLNGAIAPFFASSGCTADYTDPGPSAGITTGGPSTTKNVLVNGVYE